jgi:copper chaperone NosL
VKLALAGLALAGLTALLWRPAPAKGPEPIDYGREACAHCRMHFAVKGFAAERRGPDGALRKYDDVGCMLVAASHQESGEVWVEDHAGHGFVSALSATFVSGNDLGTPMNYGVVAFADPMDAHAFAALHGARVVAFEELLRGEHR